jgi:Holliday junction resolvasome RuvABC endonuclease subunit
LNAAVAHRVVLALDLGTKLGFALRQRDGTVTHGTESFAPRKSWSPGQRWQRFRTFLHETVTRHNVQAIAYEDVKRHAGTDAAHAYGAFLALTELVADSHRLVLMPVGVGTIKKLWTGKGNADKAAMVAQAKARGFRPETDNDADALAILHWALAKERNA